MGGTDPLIRCAKPTVYRASNIYIDKDSYDRYAVPVREEYEYINGLPYDIRVITRQGFSYIIPPNMEVRGKGFLIRFKATTGRNVEINTIDLDHTNDEDKLTEQAVSVRNKDHWGLCSTDVLTTEITMAELRGNGGALYLQNHDIIITSNINELYTHPNSRTGLMKEYLRSILDVPTHLVAGYLVRIIDNNKRFGNKFINLNGTTFRVPAEAVPGYEDGVYVIKSGMTDGDFKVVPNIVEIISFQNAKDVLGLYDTADEAKVFGNREKAFDESHKLEFQRLKNDELISKSVLREKEAEIKTLEMQLSMDKIESEKKKRQDEEELLRQKNETEMLQHQLNMASLKRKDYYEERSFERKDSSERMKWVPLVLTGVIALIVGLRK